MSVVSGSIEKPNDMRRADRLFDIIQDLRAASSPRTAAALAAKLEVTVRTIYRDIATLQARRIPIEGEPGVGYVLRRGFDLPPLMFTTEEIEAIAVGTRMINRIRDPMLQRAAESVLSKLAVALPDRSGSYLVSPRFYMSEGSAQRATAVDLAEVRDAIRSSRKMHICYVDEHARRTRRIIWPIAMAYYVDVTLIGAWCELRSDYRNFRVERVATSEVLTERFSPDRGRLLTEWLALRKDRPGPAL
jgi:predicted DNA-binding transcriptional regulator YafY